MVNIKCILAPGGKIQIWKDVRQDVPIVRVLDKSLPPAEQEIFVQECSGSREAEELFVQTARGYEIYLEPEEEDKSGFVEIELPVLNVRKEYE